MNSFKFLGNPTWWKRVVASAFGISFWGFCAAAVAFGILCFSLKGGGATQTALQEDLHILFNLMPRVLIALSIASLIWVMMPRDRMAALVGDNTGLRGPMVATLAGAVTPGGPSSSYSLLAVLASSGADRGVLVAYITAWATLGMQRILIWDVPFMGAEFAVLRFVVCLPLPILAALIARRLPLTLQIKDQVAATPSGNKDAFK